MLNVAIYTPHGTKAREMVSSYKASSNGAYRTASRF